MDQSIPNGDPLEGKRWPSLLAVCPNGLSGAGGRGRWRERWWRKMVEDEASCMRKVKKRVAGSQEGKQQGSDVRGLEGERLGRAGFVRRSRWQLRLPSRSSATAALAPEVT